MGVSLLPEVRPSSYPESSEAGFPPVKEDIVFQEEGTFIRTRGQFRWGPTGTARNFCY